MLLLKRLREEKGDSQQQVAGYLGMTRQAYSNYEIGKRNPDNETLLKLAEYFDVSTDFLLRGAAQSPPPPPPVPRDLTEEMEELLQTLTPGQALLLVSLAKKALQYVESRTEN